MVQPKKASVSERNPSPPPNFFAPEANDCFTAIVSEFSRLIDSPVSETDFLVTEVESSEDTSDELESERKVFGKSLSSELITIMAEIPEEPAKEEKHEETREESSSSKADPSQDSQSSGDTGYSDDSKSEIVAPETPRESPTPGPEDSEVAQPHDTPDKTLQAFVVPENSSESLSVQESSQVANNGLAEATPQVIISPGNQPPAQADSQVAQTQSNNVVGQVAPEVIVAPVNPQPAPVAPSVAIPNPYNFMSQTAPPVPAYHYPPPPLGSITHLSAPAYPPLMPFNTGYGNQSLPPSNFGFNPGMCMPPFCVPPPPLGAFNPNPMNQNHQLTFYTGTGNSNNSGFGFPMPNMAPQLNTVPYGTFPIPQMPPNNVPIAPSGPGQCHQDHRNWFENQQTQFQMQPGDRMVPPANGYTLFPQDELNENQSQNVQSDGYYHRQQTIFFDPPRPSSYVLYRDYLGYPVHRPSDRPQQAPRRSHSRPPVPLPSSYPAPQSSEKKRRFNVYACMNFDSRLPPSKVRVYHNALRSGLLNGRDEIAAFSKLHNLPHLMKTTRFFRFPPTAQNPIKRRWYPNKPSSGYQKSLPANGALSSAATSSSSNVTSSNSNQPSSDENGNDERPVSPLVEEFHDALEEFHVTDDEEDDDEEFHDTTDCDLTPEDRKKKKKASLRKKKRIANSIKKVDAKLATELESAGTVDESVEKDATDSPTQIESMAPAVKIVESDETSSGDTAIQEEALVVPEESIERPSKAASPWKTVDVYQPPTVIVVKVQSTEPLRRKSNPWNLAPRTELKSSQEDQVEASSEPAGESESTESSSGTLLPELSHPSSAQGPRRAKTTFRKKMDKEELLQFTNFQMN